MKKVFDDRARIAVYLDKADVIRMESKAREEGMTLAEWAREALRGELKIGGNGDRVERAIGPGAMGTAGRGTGVSRGRAGREGGAVGAGGLATGSSGGVGKPPITLPRANVCVNCEHAKHKHGGFGTSCQFEGCLCAKFE